MAGHLQSFALPRSLLPSLGSSKLTTGTTRTRRCLGAFELGAVLGAVFASRRRDEDRSVSLALGQGQHAITARMTPAEARMLAETLHAAARSASEEAVQMLEAQHV